MSILTQKYNKLLIREKNAEVYLEKCTDEQFEKWLPEFNKIVINLSELMEEYKKLTGKNMTNKEILDGFEEV